jgi:hypothetical protein
MSYGYGMGPDSGPIVSSETASAAAGYNMPHHQTYNQAQELAPPQGAISISHLLEQIMNITDQVRNSGPDKKIKIFRLSVQHDQTKLSKFKPRHHYTCV